MHVIGCQRRLIRRRRSGHVLRSTDTLAEYSISDSTLEYEVVMNKDLAQTLRNKHRGPVHDMFDRIRHLETCLVDKSDTLWYIAINQLIRSLKGILFLFRDPIIKSCSNSIIHM